MIKLCGVSMASDVIAYVGPVLRSGYIGEGNKVKEFESRLAEFLGVYPWQVVTVSSGTIALTISLRLAGVLPEDRVVSTPITCLATNEPILSLGATPLWCDVEPETGELSPDALSSLLRVAKFNQVSAAIAVHWGGYPCDSLLISSICRREGIPYIEDAASAIGSSINGQLIGNDTADFTCFSFQAIKNLTCGDGGAIVLRDARLADRARKMRWFGLDRTGSLALRCAQDPPEWGYKAHMNDISAAIGLANLNMLPGILKRLAEIAERYDAALSLSKMVTVPERDDRRVSANWLYTVLVNNASRFIKFMVDNGIEASPVHLRNDTKSMFASCHARLPGATYFDEHHVCIPIGAWLTDADVDKVISTVLAYDNFIEG
jgi:dTDP-4-amino-4,6-dideoxygalactose transaminase